MAARLELDQCASHELLPPVSSGGAATRDQYTSQPTWLQRGRCSQVTIVLLVGMLLSKIHWNLEQ